LAAVPDEDFGAAVAVLDVDGDGDLELAAPAGDGMDIERAHVHPLD